MADLDTADWPAELALPPRPSFDPHPPLSEAGRKAIAGYVQAIKRASASLSPEAGVRLGS